MASAHNLNHKLFHFQRVWNFTVHIEKIHISTRENGRTVFLTWNIELLSFSVSDKSTNNIVIFCQVTFKSFFIINALMLNGDNKELTLKFLNLFFLALMHFLIEVVLISFLSGLKSRSQLRWSIFSFLDKIQHSSLIKVKALFCVSVFKSNSRISKN